MTNMNGKRTPSIERIRAVPFELPLAGSLEWGQGSRLDSLSHVFVEVTLDSGAVGFAEAPPRPTIYGETVRSIVEVVEGVFAEQLVGRAVSFPLADGGLARYLAQNVTARGALDMAVHHALAEHGGLTLSETLDVTRDRVRVSYILGLGKPESLVAEAQRIFDLGVRVFKVKTGFDWPASIAVVRRLRDHFGDGVDLYVDANETLESGTAAERLGELRDCGVLFCEEPLPIQRVAERASLRRDEVIPLVADDSAMTIRDLERELALDTFDVLNLKPARTGFTESLQMLALAQRFGKSAMVGSQAGSGLGAARAALIAGQEAVDCPSELAFFLKLKEDVFEEPIRLQEGWLELGQLAGLKLRSDLIPR